MFGGVHDMVVATNDRIDIHGDIVDHHDKVIGGGTVAAANDKIIQFIVLENNIAFDRYPAC